MYEYGVLEPGAASRPPLPEQPLPEQPLPEQPLPEQSGGSMVVIDVDSHFMEPYAWIGKHFPELAARVPPPDFSELLAEALGGDLLASLPPSMRPDPLDLVPESFRPLAEMYMAMDPAEVADAASNTDGNVLGPSFAAPGANDAASRVAFLDEVGIDLQFVESGGISPYRQAMRSGDIALGLEVLTALNTYNTELCEGYTDRLVPVTLVDLVDIDAAIVEIARTRTRGSFVVQVKAEPVDGRSLAHPDFDRFWAAMADLGMVTWFHAGGGRATLDPSWANHGGDFRVTMALGSTQTHVVAELMLTSLILGGVLERHPRLTFVSAELGVGWLPYWLARLDAYYSDDKLTHLQGRLDLPMAPSEYARRQVRVTPLPLASQPVRPLFDLVPPEMIVFSTDYPHPEGTTEGMAHYERELVTLDAARRESFFGGSMVGLLGYAGRGRPRRNPADRPHLGSILDGLRARAELLRECRGLDVEPADHTGHDPPFGGATDDRHPHVELAPDASPAVLAAVDTDDRDRGLAVEPPRVRLGRERQRPGERRGVEAELLDPGQLPAAQELARDRVDLADVLVAEPQQPGRAVDRARDDLGPAQVGKVQPGLERRVGQHVCDRGGGSVEPVLDFEVHDEPESIRAVRRSSRRGPACRGSRSRRARRRASSRPFVVVGVAAVEQHLPRASAAPAGAPRGFGNSSASCDARARSAPPLGPRPRRRSRPFPPIAVSEREAEGADGERVGAFAPRSGRAPRHPRDSRRSRSPARRRTAS